jgi:WD40 repeat protein
LLSGSEDGTVIIWQISTWTALHSMTAKITYPVLDVAVHPTGRMAFIIYKEGIHKLWDLTEGKSVYTK